MIAIVIVKTRAQRDSAGKTSKIGPNPTKGGFGGMQLKIKMNLEG